MNGIWDLGFGIWDLGFGIWDLGFGIWDLDLGFGIWDGIGWSLTVALFGSTYGVSPSYDNATLVGDIFDVAGPALSSPPG